MRCVKANLKSVRVFWKRKKACFGRSSHTLKSLPGLLITTDLLTPWSNRDKITSHDHFLGNNSKFNLIELYNVTVSCPGHITIAREEEKRSWENKNISGMSNVSKTYNFTRSEFDCPTENMTVILEIRGHCSWWWAAWLRRSINSTLASTLPWRRRC